MNHARPQFYYSQTMCDKLSSVLLLGKNDARLIFLHMLVAH